MRLLKNLVINEVSCVIRGANKDAKVMLRKSDDDHRPLLFADIMYRKAQEEDELRGPRDEDDSKKLTAKLKEFAALMVTVDPSKSEEEHLFDFVNTAHGRKRAEHLNNLSKGETSMNRSEELLSIGKAAGGMEMICKNIIDRGSTTITEHEFSAALMEHAKANRKADESVVKAFSRILETDVDVRRAYGIAKGYPNLMSLEPTSVEVGNTVTADDSKKAYDQLMALAEKQRATSPTKTIQQLFALVMADPANAKLANAAHRRPSSTSGSELERR